jgi:hypothetical protein
MITLFLAAAPGDDGFGDFLTVLVGFVIPGALLIGGLFYRDWRRNLKIREQNIKAGQTRMEQERLAYDAQREQREREERAYKQHVALNDLTGRKLEAESKLLESQVDRDRATASARKSSTS